VELLPIICYNCVIRNDKSSYFDGHFIILHVKNKRRRFFSDEIEHEKRMSLMEALLAALQVTTNGLVMK
jgi:hypothetical protein